MRWGWEQELQDLMLAVAGASIFGAPLLFTMEMWVRGLELTESGLVGLLAAALVVNVAFGYLSGVRHHGTLWGAASDAVSALGIAIALAAALLALLGVVHPSASAVGNAATILTIGSAMSVGTMFTNSQLRHRSHSGEDQDRPSPTDRTTDWRPRHRQIYADLMDAAATVVGATIFAFNVAPTEEVLLIATRLSPWQLLALVGAELLLCYVILFGSKLEDHQVHVEESLLQHPSIETLMATTISLAIAAGLLAGFGYGETQSSWQTFVAATVVLGLPATVGGAAGRVIV